MIEPFSDRNDTIAGYEQWTVPSGLTRDEWERIMGQPCPYCGHHAFHGADPEHPEQFKCARCAAVWVVRLVPKESAS